MEKTLAESPMETTTFSSSKFTIDMIAQWQWEYWKATTFFTDYGFISYNVGDESVFIVNFFVPQHFRGQKYGKDCFNQFKEYVHLKYPFAKKITAEVQSDLPGVTEKIATFLSQGLRICYTTNTGIGIYYDMENYGRKDESITST